MSASKAEIRKEILDRRAKMTPEESAAASKAMCERLKAIELPLRSVVAGYKAIRGEVSVQAAMLHYHDHKYPLCLPCVTLPEKIMRFKAWRPKMALKKGAHGTWEPDNNELATPTVVLVPLVAFDRAGYRLGYGAGYYDATLAHLKKANRNLLAIGTAFSLQEVEALPHEPHDMRLDVIVTEKEVIRP